MENLNENYYKSKKIWILESKKGSIMRHQKQWSSHFVIWNFQSLVPLSALNSSLANSGDCCIPSKAKKKKYEEVELVLQDKIKAVCTYMFFFFFKNKNCLSEIRIIIWRKKKESNKEWSNIIGEHAWSIGHNLMLVY